MNVTPCEDANGFEFEAERGGGVAVAFEPAMEALLHLALATIDLGGDLDHEAVTIAANGHRTAPRGRMPLTAWCFIVATWTRRGDFVARLPGRLRFLFERYSWRASEVSPALGGSRV